MKGIYFYRASRVFLTGMIAANVFGVSTGAFAATAPETMTPPQVPSTRAALPIRLANPRPLASATYILKDVGGPPTSTFSSFGQPLGFNATGQFVGAGYPSTGYSHCAIYTGSAWLDLEGQKTLNCYPSSGISDANTSGTFAFVGATNVPTNDNLVGLYATVSAKTATYNVFSQNSYSFLYAMNATGLATGYTYYVPYGGFASSGPAVLTTGTSMNLAQPNCTTTSVPFCVSQPYYYASYSSEARGISATGTIFAYAANATNGGYIELNTGTHPSAMQFSLPLNTGNGPFNVRGIDDVGNVVYEEYDPAAKVYYTYTYSPTLKKSRNLGSFAGNSCTQYTPLYINGPGRVLGIAQSCSIASDQTFWTWDAKFGMVAIAFNHTGLSSFNLYLINDKGQVAGDFYTSAGAHHWGYLTPPATL